MFPDNTVLINFAIINRMDLLEKLANGNGQCGCHRDAYAIGHAVGMPSFAALYRILGTCAVIPVTRSGDAGSMRT
jgi:hypothetical protein